MLTDFQVCAPTSYGLATYPAGATFGPRRLRDFEFVWLIEGAAEYRYNRETFAAPAGSVVLCRPGGTDFFRWDPNRCTQHAYFHFTMTNTAGISAPLGEWPVVRIPGEGDILLPMFRHLLALADSGTDWQRRLTVAHMVTAFVTGELSANSVRAQVWPDAVERAWFYINDRLERDAQSPISLGEIADAAHVTQEHLCRIFKFATGWSPLLTVRLARLDRAAVLLARSNYSIAEISSLCGFASPHHFARRFKETFGQTPSAVRRAVHAGEVPPLPRLLRTTPIG